MKITQKYLKALIREEFGQGTPADDDFSKKREIYLEDEDVSLGKKLARAAKTSPLQLLKVHVSKKTGTNKVKAVIQIIKSLLDDDAEAMELLLRNISLLKRGLTQATEEPQEEL
tara:strand:- start:663 stop:1004 length:342 start_codon:yes stop_codon:yes gene_type:complete